MLSKRGLKAIGVSTFLLGFLAGCGSIGAPSDVLNVTQEPGGTSEPQIALTIQAEVQQTAAWVGTAVPNELVEIDTPTPEKAPSMAPPNLEGVRLESLIGACTAPDGYTLHERLGFCIAAPAEWVPENFDGGVAATLGTTPGQAIGLQPMDASSESECQLVVFITELSDPARYLEPRYTAIAGRSDLIAITPIEYQQVGDLVVPGFQWSTGDGESGGIYADAVGTNRLVYISHRGTACDLARVLPLIVTLRFN
mgnify:CR=1 FL=1